MHTVTVAKNSQNLVLVPLKSLIWTSGWLTVPQKYDSVDVEITICDVCERTFPIPFPILLPVSCTVVRCFTIVSILHWAQKNVQRGNLFIRVHFLGQILTGVYPVLELLRVRESIRDKVSADKDVLVDGYSSLLLSLVEIYHFYWSFCQQSS